MEIKEPYIPIQLLEDGGEEAERSILQIHGPYPGYAVLQAAQPSSPNQCMPEVGLQQTMS